MRITLNWVNPKDSMTAILISFACKIIRQHEGRHFVTHDKRTKHFTEQYIYLLKNVRNMI